MIVPIRRDDEGTVLKKAVMAFDEDSVMMSGNAAVSKCPDHTPFFYQDIKCPVRVTDGIDNPRVCW